MIKDLDISLYKVVVSGVSVRNVLSLLCRLYPSQYPFHSPETPHNQYPTPTQSLLKGPIHYRCNELIVNKDATMSLGTDVFESRISLGLSKTVEVYENGPNLHLHFLSFNHSLWSPLCSTWYNFSNLNRIFDVPRLFLSDITSCDYTRLNTERDHCYSSHLRPVPLHCQQHS